MKEEAIEKKVAQTILQDAGEIIVGNRTYHAAPPSIATLILASEAVSRLPRRQLDGSKVMQEVIANAPDCKPLAEVAAILILGAKECGKEVPVVEECKRSFLFGLIKRNSKKTIYRSSKEVLAEDIMNNSSPSALNSLVADLYKRMEVADFFALTTFLIEANLLKQTKVEAES